jgi:peptidyl-prolyl cis-trans isomerase A (cyclophilin A)
MRRLAIAVMLITVFAVPAGAFAGEKTHPVVFVSTTLGNFKIELYEDKAPVTVQNFLTYVNGKFYDGTIFHRVIQSFMIQGGGMTPDMSEKPTRQSIPLESRNGLSNKRGTLAMARTTVPDSATAQFFINVRDNESLDQPNARDGHGYAVFGKVIEGMDVVDKIRTLPTGNKGMHQDVPVQPVIIKSITEVK